MRLLLSTLALAAALAPLSARETAKKKPAGKKTPPFAWVNPLTAKHKKLPGIRHGTFRSPSMQVDIGFCIYLPPGYHDAANKDRRYPVVYMLHGGRPGDERKLTHLATFIDPAVRDGSIPPTIYVFNNGGPVSHYNYPGKDKALGKSALVEELIPHVDKSYRTIPKRAGRSIEGYSQGGRGTLRIAFEFPNLFSAASAGSAGVQHEKRISENNGAESDTVRFTPGDDAWTRARAYAARKSPGLKLLLYCGDDADLNSEANLEYSKFLDSLGIRHRTLVIPGVPHSTAKSYQAKAATLLAFHADAFRQSGAGSE